MICPGVGSGQCLFKRSRRLAHAFQLLIAPKVLLYVELDNRSLRSNQTVVDCSRWIVHIDQTGGFDERSVSLTAGRISQKPRLVRSRIQQCDNLRRASCFWFFLVYSFNTALWRTGMFIPCVEKGLW